MTATLGTDAAASPRKITYRFDDHRRLRRIDGQDNELSARAACATEGALVLPIRDAQGEIAGIDVLLPS